MACDASLSRWPDHVRLHMSDGAAVLPAVARGRHASHGWCFANPRSPPKGRPSLRIGCICCLEGRRRRAVTHMSFRGIRFFHGCWSVRDPLEMGPRPKRGAETRMPMQPSRVERFQEWITCRVAAIPIGPRLVAWLEESPPSRQRADKDGELRIKASCPPGNKTSRLRGLSML